MKTICFNTGRKYTANGQRITATLHDDGVVTFRDHDRGVTGSFKLGKHCSFDQTEVMHWYDANSDVDPQRAWQDGMMRGGCNAEYKPFVRHPHWTDKDAKAYLHTIGMTFRKIADTGEYRVAFSEDGNNSEAAAYYTNDRDDAIYTGEAMRKRRAEQKR